MFQSFSALSAERVNRLLLRVTAICWLVAKLIGWRMFTTYRVFPTSPVFDIFDRVPYAVTTYLFVFEVLMLLILVLKPINKIFLMSLLIAELLTCLLDQNRLQPWDYQYLFILFIYVVNETKGNRALGALAFILASTYVYGGLGKLNTGFIHSIWSKMLLEQFLHISSKNVLQPWVQFCGYICGLFELTMGLGLLFIKTRKISAGLLIALHFFILVFIGPAGLRYNIVVWPWNIAMACYLYLVFIRRNKETIPIRQLFAGWNLPVLICWAILPSFNFIGWWDNYLSSGVYTGNLPQMVICIKDTSKCKPLQRYCLKGSRTFCNGSEFVNLQYWSMAETKMAPYPEIRSYQKIQAKLLDQFPAAGFTFIYYREGKEQYTR